MLCIIVPMPRGTPPHRNGFAIIAADFGYAEEELAVGYHRPRLTQLVGANVAEDVEMILPGDEGG